MQDYEYKALNNAGSPKSGIIHADSQDDAIKWVRDQKWFPVEVKKVKTHTVPIKNKSSYEDQGKIKTLSKKEVKNLFESQKTKQYMKFAEVAFRFPFENETLVVTCGGKIETVQKIKKDQIVIMALGIGTEAETYAINLDIFQEKYEVCKMPVEPESWEENDFYQGELSTQEIIYINNVEWTKARPIPKATIDAFRYSGETFKFVAPWGAEMLCENGDMLARTIGKKNDIYRIEKDAFAVTYKEAE